MIEILIFNVFLLVLVLAIARLFLQKRHKDEQNVSVQIRSVGQSSIEPENHDTSLNPLQEQDYQYDCNDIKTKQNNTNTSSINFSSLGKIIFLLAIICLGYSFKDDLQIALSSFISRTHAHKEESPLLSKNTNMNIGGVNWHKIVATNSKGLPFTGWVSEFSIKEKPPKPSKVLGMVDDIRKNIGLPTAEEQVKSIKNFKKISGNLKQTMTILRNQSKN